MNHLELVQKAIRKSGSKTKIPTTLIGAKGLTFLFSEWVSDAWVDIQNERLDRGFRASLDLTLSLSAGVDTYAMPTGLESINLRTLTVNVDDSTSVPLEYIRYEYWARWLRDRAETSPGYPQSITFDPTGQIIVYPEPDDTHVLRFDGELEIEVFPTTYTVDTYSSPANLDDNYHDIVLWRTLIYFSEHFEDSGKLAESQERYRAISKRVNARFMPLMYVEEGHLY